MPTLLFYRGLPASGKTHHAKEFLKGKRNWVRINNDDLTLALFPSGTFPQYANALESLRNDLILKSMDKGLNILIDNTNLNPKHELWVKDQIIKFNTAASDKDTHYVFELVEFTHIPISVCLERNRARVNTVPSGAIIDMYEKYLKPIKTPTVSQLPPAVIFDIDGTIAKAHDRSPYDYSKVNQDLPIPENIELLAMYRAAGHIPIFITGRDEVCRVDTYTWLREHCNFTTHDTIHLYMRASKDKRKDTEIKKEIYMTHIHGKCNVKLWVEDRLRNVEMARYELGLHTLQTGQGDF